MGWAKLSTRKGGLIPASQIFFFLGGRAGPSLDTWAGPPLARPKVNVNYLQNVIVVDILHATKLVAENGG